MDATDAPDAGDTDVTGGRSDQPQVHGLTVDSQTRCVHYHGPTDVVAMRLACCAGFWPCHACHDEQADHPIRVVPREDVGLPRVLCGVCRHVMTVEQYRGASRCPRCAAEFNPRCAAHAHLYFETEPAPASGQV